MKRTAISKESTNFAATKHKASETDANDDDVRTSRKQVGKSVSGLELGMGTTQVDSHTHLNRHLSCALHTLALISTSEFLPPYDTAQ